MDGDADLEEARAYRERLEALISGGYASGNDHEPNGSQETDSTAEATTLALHALSALVGASAPSSTQNP